MNTSPLTPFQNASYDQLFWAKTLQAAAAQAENGSSNQFAQQASDNEGVGVLEPKALFMLGRQLQSAVQSGIAANDRLQSFLHRALGCQPSSVSEQGQAVASAHGLLDGLSRDLAVLTDVHTRLHALLARLETIA